ncbi:SLC13 family permease [Martelella radicis]|uniref:Di/tricarboxylate transporter n=1 Tax=Martelella radicis TaxID=1397476 RepID=A0A7W6KKG2_9HYPH|nr:SLC13 family permease [Martelella radicis]MBB4122685.1 di/tricarboxylate transporter [Martelella radicis]
MDYFYLTSTLFVVLGAIIAFATDRFSIEAVSLGVLAALLAIYGLVPYQGDNGESLSSAELLSGFSSPALVTVLALLIVGKGLFATDAMEGITRHASRLCGSRPRSGIALILVAAGSTSAFLNNTPVVVIFIPVLTSLAASFKIPPYQIFMPLSFVTILGGMTTVIGSSTNMIAAGIAAERGLHISLFDITGLGVILALVGYVYVLLFLPRVLQARKTEHDASTNGDGGQFVGEIAISATSRFAGLAPRSGFFPQIAPFSLHSIVRADEVLLPPFHDDIRLLPGDLLEVAASRKAFLDVIASGEAVTFGQDPESPGESAPRRPGPHYHLAEAVIAPGSRFEGRTVRFCGIQPQFHVSIVGIRRKNRMGRGPFGFLRLEAGDTLLLGGIEDDIMSMRGNHDILLLEHSAQSVPPRSRALVAALIFAAVVLLSATGVSPIAVNAVLGALAMIATGCITLQQAARAFDRQIFLLIGTSIAMATALEVSGGASLIASGAIALSGGSSPAIAITILFIAVAILTNVISNNAAAALFMPIALDMAGRIGAPPLAFAAAVIFAANCSFATPMGYQTNLMVMGPGHYTFADFIRGGLPLVIIMALVFAILAPFYYQL